MKKSCFILLAGLLTMVSAFATNEWSRCLIPGERSFYTASWMGLPLVWSETKVVKTVENEQELISITMITRNYAAYEHIYKVDNRMTALINPKTALPIRFEMVQNEGRVHKNNTTFFDHENGTAVYMDRLTKDIRVEPIRADTRDILSFLYVSRRDKLSELAKQKHTIFSEGKLYELKLKLRKKESISISGHGKITSWEVEPIAEFDGLFIRQGKIFFWISDSDLPMITMIKAKVPVGSITVKLNEVSGTGDPFWDKPDK